MADDLEQRGINVIRGLAMDAVQKANSGHPGTPMALAPLAHVLWTRIMKYDASASDWPDRDRFVLSAGHASMLLYSMLYATGYGLELDDLRQFRQWGSLTPGHPEYGHTNGVEVTTGPLGQGFANAVGFAIDEKHLRERFGAEVCDHRVFGICSDGDFMEGISHEAASLAGHLKLGRMVFVYDDNHITIDGPTELAYSDDVPKRFEAYGWHVVQLGEVANDLDALEAGLRAGIAEETRPTLLVLRSHIGYPSPKVQDTAAAHGNPLGADEVAKVKEILGLPPEDFFVPDDVLLWYREAGPPRRRRAPGVGRAPKPDEYEACLSGAGLHGWEQKLPTWQVGASLATRTAIEEVLTAVVDVVPGPVHRVGRPHRQHRHAGQEPRHVHARRRDRPPDPLRHPRARDGLVGERHGRGRARAVRRHVLRVQRLHAPAVRLAAIMQAKVCFVWTHDSVGVGEDGPTHQPVEQLASLRAMPGLRVIRPADANEVAAAWKVHLDGDGPTALLLTRQKVPVLDGTAERAPAGVPAGAYVLAPEGAARPDVVLIGTGSEVQVCVAAREQLATRGIAARVVSMPSWYLFEQQPDDYRADVLPTGVPTLAVEAGVRFGWERYADDVVSIDRFGASAPGEVVMRELGITPEHTVERALALLDAVGPGGS